jgi:hypothetical protein
VRLVPSAALLVVLVLGACAGRRAQEPAPDPAVLTRIDAFHASRLVISLPPSPEPPATLATLDGLPVPSAAYRVRLALPGGPRQAWLPEPGAWSSIPAKERRGLGVWVVVVETPESSDARVLSVAGRSYQVNWLPSTALLPSPRMEVSEPLLNPWRPVIEEPLASDTGLLGRVLDEAASPLTRWRFRLLLDGLTTLDGHPAAEPFADPVVEAIARQNEDRWRVALAWLWSASPELAWRLKQRLAAVVDFGGGVYAPAWSVDHTSLDRLLEDLLNPSLSPERRRDLAEAWLRAQPSGIAWVMDDGGVLDDRRQSIIAAVGFTNLASHTTRAWVDTSTQADAEFRPMLAQTTLKLLVPVPPCAGQPVLTSGLTAHVGTSSSLLPVLCTRIPVEPPGLSIGPLARDYTMQTWFSPQGGSALTPEPEWATAVLLHRPPPEPTAPVSSVESRRWELVVECRMTPGILEVEALRREAVRVYFGPSDRPTAILRVDLTGAVTSELPVDPDAPPELAPPAGRVDITRGADRWSFRLSLPPGSIERDGTVRVGIARTDALGRRSAWPRALLPWQAHPGRAALDISAWPVR